MQALKWKRTILASLIFLSYPIFPYSALGAMPEADYEAALQVAEKRVSKNKTLRLGANTLSGRRESQRWLKDLLGSPYKVGDQWDTAVWQINRSTMRRTGNPTHLLPEIVNFGIFHYEVINIKTGDTPTVTLKITQIETPQSRTIDPRVASLNLTMTDEFGQIEKTYFYKGHPAGVRVSAEGIRSAMTPLELFPLDIPEIATADRKEASRLPELPTKIQSFIEQTQFKPNFSRSVWFEQDDFFGRPIQVLWQQGDPWPSYLNTAYGISLLLPRGNR